MSWLLALFPGRIYIYAAATAVIFALGGTSAWKVQAWRITNIKNEHTQAMAVATAKVAAAESANQTRIIEAQNENAKLRQTNVANNAAARTELGRLRSALQRPAETTQAACIQRTDTTSELLAQCGEAITELARAADGHVADKVMILQAWPK